MSKSHRSHVFVSYVREDAELVDKLVLELRRRGAEVWIDRERIQPGQRWQDAIRRAIGDGAYFVAIFSASYESKSVNFMNEELTLAIEHLRLRSLQQTWFVPVLFAGGVLPDRSVGGGETLRSFQWVDLSGDWDRGLEVLCGALGLAKLPKTPEEWWPGKLICTECRGPLEERGAVPAEHGGSRHFYDCLSDG